MKICHLIITKNFAGSEKYCLDLANYQSQLGNEVSIVTLNHKYCSNFNKLAHQNIKIFFLNSFFYKFYVKKIVINLKPDIIHSHLGRASRYISSLKIPKITTLHIKYKVKDHQKNDGIIYLNDEQSLQLDTFKKHKIKINNWIPEIPKIFETEVLKIKNHLKINEDYVFGYFGRLNKSKNVKSLINAFIKSDLKNCKLLIIGEGEEKNHLKSMTEHNNSIIFLDHQTDIYPYYEVIDCFVLPSVFEPFGIVIVEAMFFGKDIISTDVEISKFLPKESIVRKDSDNELVDALKRFYSFGRRKNKYDLSPFDRSTQIQKIMEFYNLIINKKNK